MKKCKEKEKYLTSLYETSNAVPNVPRKEEIKSLLFQCIEMHYGDLSSLVPKEDVYRRVFEEMSTIIDKYKGLT